MSGVREFAGEFETHLTVAPRAGDDARLRAWAGEHGLKYTRILLDRGRAPDQPMLTATGHGTLTDQRAAAHDRTELLRGVGFAVVRVKIEASPYNADVPRSAREAAALPPECYFEHHVKLVLPGDAAVAGAGATARRHAAHLSRNARRALTDGRHERFVTQRCRGIGRPEARRRLDSLLAALVAVGYPAIEVEQEFVVVDDNPGLDAGWLDEPPGRA